MKARINEFKTAIIKMGKITEKHYLKKSIGPTEI